MHFSYIYYIFHVGVLKYKINIRKVHLLEVVIYVINLYSFFRVIHQILHPQRRGTEENF
jgi:hypothetical protein